MKHRVHNSDNTEFDNSISVFVKKGKNEFGCSLQYSSSNFAEITVKLTKEDANLSIKQNTKNTEKRFFIILVGIAGIASLFISTLTFILQFVV